MPNSNDNLTLDSTAVSAPRPTDKELLAALGRAHAAGDPVAAQRIQQMLFNNQYQATPAPQKWEQPGGNDAAPAAAPAGIDDLEVIKYLLGTAGVNALSGIKGLSTLPSNIIHGGFDKGMEQSAKDIADYQAKYGPSDNLSPAGVNAVQQHLIPAVNFAKSLPFGNKDMASFSGIANDLSKDYTEGSQEWADLAGRAGGPRAAGVVGATLDTAPMLLGGEGLLAKYAGKAAPEAAGAAQTAAHATEPLLPDGSRQGTLEREYAASRRDRGTAISVNKATDVGHPEAGLIGYHPDATVFDAHDPEGQHLGRLVAEPSADGTMLQGRTADVFDENNRRQGIGTQLLQKGVDHAHEHGLDWGSDVKLSPGQVATYMKLQEKGYPIAFNPTSTVQDDKFLTSGDGQPVLRVSPQVPADQATTDETEHPNFGPGSWIARQAYAEGGEVAPLLSGIGHLAEKYATKDPKIAQAVADRIAENGGISYHPVTSTQPTSGYSVAIHPGREAILPTPPTGKDVHSYIVKNDDAFTKDHGAHFGAWENNGRWYMDVANIDPDMDSAMAKARQHNQMAIFDITHGADITNPDYKPPAPKGSDKIRQVAADYMQQNGLQPAPAKAPQVDPERAKAIASAYESMQHAPDDPRVRASYDALIKETMAQFQAAKAAGLKPEFIPHGAPDPYGSPHGAVNDITENNHLWVFPTSSGFGDPEGLVDLNGHPLLQPSGESFGDIPATHNDIFRVVHDYFGHAKEGNGFRAPGEEGAWLSHSQMYSPEARPAMTSETRGQNSWVNFGPHADANRGASGADTVYAPQKAGLLPDEFNDPGYADGGPAEAEPIIGGIAHLVEKFAPNAHAAQVASKLAEDGAVTYNPTTGDLHHEGYLVPQPGKSASFDTTPTAHDIHDFMIENQDAFDKPNSVLHAESTPEGSHLHVALHEPDFEHAMLVAHGEGAPGVRELHTGQNFPVGPDLSAGNSEAEQVRNLPDVMGQFDPEANERQRAPWVHGQQTVANPQRNAFPGSTL